MSKIRLEQKWFYIGYDTDGFRPEMTEYIEGMYNDSSVEVVSMNIFHERSKLSDHGIYRVVFMLKDIEQGGYF